MLREGVERAFTRERDGKPRFHTLSRLSDRDVADALAAIRARVVRFLVRRGVVEVDDGLTVVGDALRPHPSTVTREP